MEGNKPTLERHSFCIQYWQLGVRGGLSQKGPLGSVATITVLLADTSWQREIIHQNVIG